MGCYNDHSLFPLNLLCDFKYNYFYLPNTQQYAWKQCFLVLNSHLTPFVQKIAILFSLNTQYFWTLQEKMFIIFDSSTTYTTINRTLYVFIYQHFLVSIQFLYKHQRKFFYSRKGFYFQEELPILTSFWMVVSIASSMQYQ